MGVFKLKKRKICIVLTTRGNYAKMKSVIKEIQNKPDLELQVIIGGMVVLEKYGRLLQTIKDETKIIVDRRINFVIEGESLATMAKSSGLAVSEFSTAFEDLKPDIVLVIADRLHITIQQVLDMPVSHYNLWLAYLKKEQEQYKTKQSLAEARNFK